jgi:hypothetical protein
MEPLIGTKRYARWKLANGRRHGSYGYPVHDCYGGITLHDKRRSRLSVRGLHEPDFALPHQSSPSNSAERLASAIRISSSVSGTRRYSIT